MAQLNRKNAGKYTLHLTAVPLVRTSLLDLLGHFFLNCYALCVEDARRLDGDVRSRINGTIRFYLRDVPRSNSKIRVNRLQREIYDASLLIKSAVIRNLFNVLSTFI